MQLSATNNARYFIHDEYFRIEIINDMIIVSSNIAEEHIPFSVWNGCVHVKRGLIWGQLEFFSHLEGENQSIWVVQGLPWPECKQFAEQAVHLYKQWHQGQCQKLAIYIPRWKQQLAEIKAAERFVPHSMCQDWKERVQQDLCSLNMNIVEISQRLPNVVDELRRWYCDTSSYLFERNCQWLETERDRWAGLFAELESSPLNVSQQSAVLLNDDYNLVLAGAGSGKTSVMSARVAYLIESQLAQPESILLLAFGRDAAEEMRQRLASRVGPVTRSVTVNTFHQLGLFIINSVEQGQAVISPLATDSSLKENWCMDWLKKHWMTPTNFKRWQKHLNQWPIAYIKGDDELGSHVEDAKLIGWLVKQLEQLAQTNGTKKSIQELLIQREDYVRLNSELSLCWPCYQSWLEQLKTHNHLDFNTMITKATEYVKKGKFKSPWTNIMVDEYQDISPARLALIEALTKQAKGNLFAVGDDWQAIYQFAGSNVDLTTGFKTRFPHSTVTYLDTTYRFNNKLGEVANPFVLKNPIQIDKPLNSFSVQKKNAVVLLPFARIERELDDLNRRAKDVKSLLLLGRYHYHCPELLPDWQKQFPKLDIKFMTCHASKGKEADYVFILNVDEGQFPAKNKIVHLDQALVQSNDDFPDAEERRLFYVAMTRAREKVWVTYNGSGSTFIQELMSEPYPISKKK